MINIKWDNPEKTKKTLEVLKEYKKPFLLSRNEHKAPPAELIGLGLW